jgi:hypothetical protein
MTQRAFSAYEKTAPSQTFRAAFSLEQCNDRRLFVVLGLQDLATTVIAVRADMVTQMRFACGRLNCQRRRAKVIVRTVHAALGWGLFILLNGHDSS